jgi:MYXO-CTERM domain-containing protein
MRSPLPSRAPHALLARRSSRLALACLTLVSVVALFALFARDASALGTFKLKSSEAQEVSGAWHVYVTIELPKPPLTAHQTMKFNFTKTMAYERALIDGHNEPVLNRQALQNQTPSIESLDVDFADPSGKIFKGTRFDFGLTRNRGYEAGEYKVEVKTTDGTTVGSTATLILKGDNPVVDRRAIAFNAKESGVKKVDGVDAGAKVAQNDDAPASNTMGEVTPTGTAQPFIAKEGLEKSPEEEIKTRPKGCGCSLPGGVDPGGLLWLAPLAGLGALVRRRRTARASAPRAIAPRA